jgi:hypothetical protein
MIRNVHERLLAAGPDEVGALLDSLSSPDDRLWPNRRWPAMKLDHGLEVGSDGGHGPVRYKVDRYEPGRLVAFAFTPKFPLDGEHRLEVLAQPDGTTLLRHTIEGTSKSWLRLCWPLCFRWLHDALIEDALDRAEADVAKTPWEPRPLSAQVRFLRWTATSIGHDRVGSGVREPSMARKQAS